MKKLPKVLTTALIVWFGLAAGASHSATSTLTFTDNTGTGGNFDSTFSRVINSSDTPFIDHWEFGLTPAMGGPGGSSIISGFDSSGFNVSFTNYKLVDTTANSVIATGSTLFGVFSNFSFAALDTTHLYDLTVEGSLASGFDSGSYAGNISISPVPEPLTYIMLLAGLTVVGYTVHSRRRNGY